MSQVCCGVISVEMEQHLKRAKHLFEQGRFEQYVSTNLERFEALDAKGVRFEGFPLAPYFDSKMGKVVYGQVKTTKKGDALMFLAFPSVSYFYDANSRFEWYDAHTYGFEDGD